MTPGKIPEVNNDYINGVGLTSSSSFKLPTIVITKNMKNNERDYERELLNSTYGGSQKTDWVGYAMVIFAGLFLAYLVAHAIAFVDSAVI